ncbi:MAG TPA: TetR/AcrR family transcriptional regulator [Mycobacteriales bacterium]|nr:TetR/AcrR family transcriptional regulator [Mycobacteriales bacterium]
MVEQSGVVEPPARPRRQRSPKGQGDRLREEILQATERLLERLGNEAALSLRAIAREVGIAAPSIYLHFADRTELVWAALAVKYAHVAESLGRADTAAGADPLTRLRAQAHAYCQFGMDFPNHYRLMYGTTLDPVAPERLREHPARLVLRPLGDALRRCDRGGARLRIPADRAVVVLWSGLHGIISLWRTMPDPRQAGRVFALADDLIVLLLRLPMNPSGD